MWHLFMMHKFKLFALMYGCCNILTMSSRHTTTALALVLRDLTDGTVNQTSGKSTAALRPVDLLSHPLLTSQPAANIASPSANNTCCRAGSENLTTQFLSTTAMLPTAVGDVPTWLAGDELGIGTILDKDQAAG